jgi:hypothetical protein
MKLLNDFITLHLDLYNLKLNNKASRDCLNKKCKKEASFNYKKYSNIIIRKLIYCRLHKLDNMIDVKNTMCITCNNVQPYFNYKNEKKALYCGKCASPGMVNIKDKMCITCNNTIPYFNYKNKKKALYCRSCKTDEMIDIKHKKCKTDLCDIYISNKQYKGYCLRCFIYNFPESNIIRDYGTRESKVSEFIKETYPDLNITYNKIINGGCSSHRPDIFIDCLTHSVIIEVDEHQHKNNKSYNPECELRRLNNIFTDLADRPIVFIRFNPDSYINNKNKLVKSCFEYTEDKGLPKALKTLHIRLKKLKEVIDKNLAKVPKENILTIQLYYDGY